MFELPLFQVRFLQDQARKVLEDARLNALVHKTNCNFKKIPGKTYYIYKQKKNPDEEFMSMISPEEWGEAGPEFVGGYKLEYDMSWTELQVSQGIKPVLSNDQDLKKESNKWSMYSSLLLPYLETNIFKNQFVPMF